MGEMLESINLRKAVESDINLIVGFIREIAEYEKMLNEVIATKDEVYESIFKRKEAEVLIIEKDSNPIGYVVYFFNYSTFIGRTGFYLEDIYIKPKYRGNGYGKKVFKYLTKLAYEKGCHRMEWSCLNWNKPSIEFYKSLGAVPMSEWTVYRLTRDKFKDVYESKM